MRQRAKLGELLKGMIGKYIVGKSLITKGLVLATPMLGYVSIEQLTGSVGWGVVASAFFTMMGVIANNRSKVIAAKAAAIASGTASQDGHLSNVVQTMGRLHQQEIEFWKRRERHQHKVEVLIRATKHKAFGAYQAGIWAIRDREDLLKTAGVPFERYVPQSLREITGDEDRKMIEDLFPELLLTPAIPQS